MAEPPYDPFEPGDSPVAVRTLEAFDAARERRFPCEVWHPAVHGGPHPLVVFSHASGFHRRQSTFLCAHLASHGYVVAALDHSEVVAPELRRREGESAQQKDARIRGWIANRVPDVRFLIDRMLDRAFLDPSMHPDPGRIGLAGHSFGGWTVLATPESDERVAAIVAMAPAGASNPPPGIIPCTLTFEWKRAVPTLYLVAEADTALPMEGMRELFARNRSPSRMFVLRDADHGHFFDEPTAAPGQCAPAEAHRFTCALALCHFDAVLRGDARAAAFLQRDAGRELAARGVRAFALPGR
ncbi:MAG TPA: dienelactone hydrolase family protein [Usitatibacter sp.]|jgi:dienelactone hydrolase|nr:dienelactone hydrolase family protein [Usitatibacter sp.]